MKGKLKEERGMKDKEKRREEESRKKIKVKNVR